MFVTKCTSLFPELNKTVLPVQMDTHRCIHTHIPRCLPGTTKYTKPYNDLWGKLFSAARPVSSFASYLLRSAQHVALRAGYSHLQHPGLFLGHQKDRGTLQDCETINHTEKQIPPVLNPSLGTATTLCSVGPLCTVRGCALARGLREKEGGWGNGSAWRERRHRLKPLS